MSDAEHATASTLRRIGAVARMLRMPVATLRVWERRYGLSQAALSPSGQRLYSSDDVRRLALIKQLTELGHAIGSVAGLDMEALQRVAATHAQAEAVALKDEAPRPGAPGRHLRLVVIGLTLGARLHRPVLLRRLALPVQMLGPFESIAEAEAALAGKPVDAVLIHAPQLHGDWLSSLTAAAPRLSALPKAVLYSFAAEAVCDALVGAGISLMREPQADAVLAQWLRGLARQLSEPPPSGEPSLPAPAAPQAARRWDDAALLDFAQRSSTVACECPRHVAELLLQLAHFEAYSASCENRSQQDAHLHAYLHQVAADARARFEAALAEVARHEGLLLP